MKKFYKQLIILSKTGCPFLDKPTCGLCMYHDTCTVLFKLPPGQQKYHVSLNGNSVKLEVKNLAKRKILGILTNE